MNSKHWTTASPTNSGARIKSYEEERDNEICIKQRINFILETPCSSIEDIVVICDDVLNTIQGPI